MSLDQLLATAPNSRGLGDLDSNWDQAVGAALDAVAVHSTPAQALVDAGRAWSLLAWAERSATRLTYARSQRALEQAVLAVIYVVDSKLVDARDALIVGSLVRRASQIAGLDYETAVVTAGHRVDSAYDVTRLLALPSAVPATHREVNDGRGVRFERVAPAVDVDELLRHFGE